MNATIDNDISISTNANNTNVIIITTIIIIIISRGAQGSLTAGSLAGWRNDEARRLSE